MEINTAAAAKILDKTRGHVCGLASRGILQARKERGCWVFDSDDVERRRAAVDAHVASGQHISRFGREAVRKACAWCNETFIAENRVQKYCSKYCISSVSYARQKEKAQ